MHEKPDVIGFISLGSEHYKWCLPDEILTRASILTKKGCPTLRLISIYPKSGMQRTENHTLFNAA